MGETLYHQLETDCKKWFELCHIKDKIIWKERGVSQEKINDLTEQNKILMEKLERVTERLDVEKTRFNRLKEGE